MVFHQKIKIIFFFLTVAIASGCYNDKEELLYPGITQSVDCSTVPAKFSANVLPLVTSKCAVSGCHDAISQAGGLILQTHVQISGAKNMVNTRAVIVKDMPRSGALSPSEINILKCWIEAGAPNN
jgi:uncharacterized membrane protein